MRQMEKDLDTQLDWIAVDHHNTGHPHTHIIGERQKGLCRKFCTRAKRRGRTSEIYAAMA
jgi:type IV secretory pathway VirD2 relaxase